MALSSLQTDLNSSPPVSLRDVLKVLSPQLLLIWRAVHRSLPLIEEGNRYPSHTILRLRDKPDYNRRVGVQPLLQLRLKLRRTDRFEYLDRHDFLLHSAE